MNAFPRPSGRPARSFRASRETIAVLDLGASKAACAILHMKAPRFGFNVGARSIKILGSAAVSSSEFARARIADPAAAAARIRHALARAEAQARVTVEEALITGQFPGLRAELFGARISGPQSHPGKENARAIRAAAESRYAAVQRKLLNLFTSPIEIGPNQVQGRSCAGKELDVVAVSMPLRGIREIEACLAKSPLKARGYIAGPIAAALAVTNPVERSAGILVIDIGAQTAGWVYYSQGIPVLLDSFPAGGEQLTDEIASAFGLSKSGAERLKIRHGGIFNGLQADIDLPAANGYTGEKISKFRFNRLVRSAASTLFDAINRRLKGAGYSIPVGGIVLTGGASSLPGLTELASHVLEGEARTARPALLDGLNPDSAMSALVGACLYASRHQSEAEMLSAMGRASEDSSYASRIGQWLRASF